jgi:hypothetical protein
VNTTSQTNTERRLESSEWAKRRYGYTATTKAAFYNFIKRNGIPFIRLGARKIAFDPVAVEAFEARRTVGERRSA